MHLALPKREPACGLGPNVAGPIIPLSRAGSLTTLLKTKANGKAIIKDPKRHDPDLSWPLTRGNLKGIGGQILSKE